jgi:hypothetical protein
MRPEGKSIRKGCELERPHCESAMWIKRHDKKLKGSSSRHFGKAIVSHLQKRRLRGYEYREIKPFRARPTPIIGQDSRPASGNPLFGMDRIFTPPFVSSGTFHAPFPDAFPVLLLRHLVAVAEAMVARAILLRAWIP